MALLNCADCGHSVSTTARYCPGCGAPPRVVSSSSPSEDSFLSRKFCTKCGSSIALQVDVCSNCGAQRYGSDASSPAPALPTGYYERTDAGSKSSKITEPQTTVGSSDEEQQLSQTSAVQETPQRLTFGGVAGAIGTLALLWYSGGYIFRAVFPARVHKSPTAVAAAKPPIAASSSPNPSRAYARSLIARYEMISDSYRRVIPPCSGTIFHPIFNMVPACKIAALTAIPIIVNGLSWCSSTVPPDCLSSLHSEMCGKFSNLKDNLAIVASY